MEPVNEPLHVQVEHLLLQKIESGEYGVGDLLPKELDLMQHYGVSRITIRRALQSLTDAGYLKRIKHKGTFVQPQKIEEPLLKIQSFTQEMLHAGQLPTTKNVALCVESAGGDAAKELQLCGGEPVLHLERVRCVHGEAIVLFDTYLPYGLGLPKEAQAYHGSLYALLRQHGAAVKKIRQYMGAALADARLAHSLPCAEGDAVLLLRRTGFAQNGTPVEYTVGRYLGERYEYYFELDETKEDKHA